MHNNNSSNSSHNGTTTAARENRARQHLLRHVLFTPAGIALGGTIPASPTPTELSPGNS